MSTGNGQSLDDLFSCSQRPGAWMGAAYVIFQDKPGATYEWPSDWASGKQRSNSRSRSPAAERAMPAAAEVDKPANEVTPKKGGDPTKDDGP